MNKSLVETAIDERFITLSLLVLEPHTGGVQHCSAGHPPILIRRADRTVEELGSDVRGFPLGIVADAAYDQIDFQLRQGDVVVLYSDGVADARNVAEELFDTQNSRHS